MNSCEVFQVTCVLSVYVWYELMTCVLDNWRLKEQLIRELVKTGQEAEKINADNEERIRALEEEKALANSDLIKLQKTLEELMARENTDKQQKDQLLT